MVLVLLNGFFPVKGVSFPLQCCSGVRLWGSMPADNLEHQSFDINWAELKTKIEFYFQFYFIREYRHLPSAWSDVGFRQGFWNCDMKNNNTCRGSHYFCPMRVWRSHSPGFETGAAFYEISDKRTAVFSMLSLKYARMTWEKAQYSTGTSTHPGKSSQIQMRAYLPF